MADGSLRWADFTKTLPGRPTGSALRVVDWFLARIAYKFRGWGVVQLVDAMQAVAVVTAVVAFIMEIEQRGTDREINRSTLISLSWERVRAAKGVYGNQGQIEALEILNRLGIDLFSLDLTATYLVRVRLPGARMASAKLARANLSLADFSGAHLAGARLTDADLCGADFRGARLDKADLSGVGLCVLSPDPEPVTASPGADFSDADMSHANLKEASLHRAIFDGADLGGADLGNGGFYDASFVGADLRSADLRGARLHGANLADAQVTQRQLDAACGDDATQVPSGMKPPPVCRDE